MDLDPLSFFANEAEKDKPIEKDPLPPAITHQVSDTALQKELEVDEDWIDKEKRNSKRFSRTSNDVGGQVGVGFTHPSNGSNIKNTRRPLSVPPPPPPGQTAQNTNISEDIPSLDTHISMLTGETTIIKLPDVLIQLYQSKLVPGTLFMTTYRLSFMPSPAHLVSLGASNPSVYSMINVPLSSIDKIEREKKQNKPQSILITCKDIRQHRIFLKGKVDPKTHETILSDEEIERAYSAMYRYAFPNNIRYVFAFSAAIPASLRNLYLPAEPFNMEREFSRQGVLNVSKGRPSRWRLSTANSSFKLCDTYPKLLVVPVGIDDVQVHNVAKFRSGCRFPALSYFHANNGASIWRSAQPKAGMSGSSSVDELFLDLIARSTSARVSPTGEVRQGTPLLFIIDCRPKSSALANRAAGAGYEVNSNYPNTKIDFFNIGNIHVMRDSLKSMASIFATNSSTANDTSFGKVVEDAGWLTHVRLVLKASWDCAMSVVKGVPVLVHCSHGWDRTSQVLCLSQILLDPYFRTFDGFAALVEKDFISFGHPFQMRCGHGYDSHTRPDNEISPIFLQFLDCTFQLVSQFPQYFEFSTKYLLAIADHVYSCRFGTFLGNSDKEREQMGRDDCMSVWSYLKYNKAVLASPHYMDPFLEGTPTTHIFLPSLSKVLRNVTVWKDFFFRWSSVHSLIDPPHVVFSEIHDNGVMRPVPASPDCLFEKPLAHSDFELQSMSSASDSWEALYRSERRLRETLQEKLALLGDGSAVPEQLDRERGRRLSVVHQAEEEIEVDVEIDAEVFEGLDITETSSFLGEKDEFGLLSSLSPSVMFHEGEAGEKVDLLAIAALNDKEKETTDDEGEHEEEGAAASDDRVTAEEDRRQEGRDFNSMEEKERASYSEERHCDESEPVPVPVPGVTRGEECDSRLIIQEQREEIERLKVLLSKQKGD